MEGVNSQQQVALSNNEFVAVAIAEPRQDQRHTGIFFRFDKNQPHEFLHLGWQFLLIREPPKHKYLWVQPALSQRRLVQVAAICDQVAIANSKGIPYSFGPPNDCFDEQSCRFLLGPTNTGLTCASFVLAIFHRAGLQLLRYGSWPPPSTEDIEWQRKILDNLKNPNVTPPADVSQQHIDFVANEIGSSVRYRPEQVAASALKRRFWPVSFRLAERLGKAIVACVRGESTAPYLTKTDRLITNLKALFGW